MEIIERKISEKILNLIEPYSVKNAKIGLGMILVVIFTIINIEVNGQEKSITEKNIRFIEYPGFPGAQSTWNDIGYNPKYNTVYIGVTNHIDSLGLYEYNVSKNDMELKGFISDLANLRSFQWQGKIHSKFIADPDGNMYFSTDGGDTRHLDFMDGPHGYAGGYLMKWDPAGEKLTNLGMGLQYESMKDIDLDPETGIIYAVTFHQVHFLVYDTKKNNLRDLGRFGSSYVPRVLFTDHWGNCYCVDWRLRLVKYEKSIDKLVFDKESLPVFPSTSASDSRDHLTLPIIAYAKDEDKGIIYFITEGAKLLAFHPQKIGIGKVEDLGGVFDAKGKEKWDYLAGNLNIGNNGKLYYFIGGHGHYAIKNKTVFIEFDPHSHEKRILFEYPTTTIQEVTGSSVKDKEGNLYFAARKDDGSGASKPFMIKFNPEKEVQ